MFRMFPVDKITPLHDGIILELVMKLGSASRQNHLRHAVGRQTLSVYIRCVEEVHAVDDEALL